MYTKDKLKELKKCGFSNAFISKNVGMTYDRVYNAAGDRATLLSPKEHERIDLFYVIAMKLINDCKAVEL